MPSDTPDPLDGHNWMMVTPSYRGDLEQFSLLNESFQRFAPAGLEHQVIVDRQDLELFQPFTHPRMRLVTAEDVLPGMVRKINKPRSMWVSTRFPPTRNWVAQQLIKIHAAVSCERPYILFVDSDVVFLKRFEMDRFTDGQRLALSRVHNHFPDLDDWRKTSAQLLGLDNPENFAQVNYVSNLIPWRRDTANAMVQRIEANSRLSWTAAIATNLRFSEYTLYGVFGDECIGLDEAGHYGWDDPILNLLFEETAETKAEFADLLAGTLDEHVGAMFHSKNDHDPANLRAAVEDFWETHESS